MKKAPKLVRLYCHWFGHALKIPVYPDPFLPIWCLRCGRVLDSDTGDWLG